jgi:hypothetical protein
MPSLHNTNGVKKGVQREKQIKEITSAIHKTYNTVHDQYYCEIY